MRGEGEEGVVRRGAEASTSFSHRSFRVLNKILLFILQYHTESDFTYIF